MASVSWLCAPATNHKVFHKAKDFNAEIVILDLEDGLALTDKNIGRDRVLTELQSQRNNKYAVRINYIADEQGMQDLNFFIAHKIAPEYIIIPKFGNFREAEIVREVLSPFNPDLKIIPVIESIKGLRMLRSTTNIPDYIDCLHFGAADFALDLGFDPKKVNLIKYKEELSFLCRELGTPLIDSPYFKIEDKEGLYQDCIIVKEMGYRGKIAIHPSQLEAINTVFKCKQEELVQAHQTLKLHQKSAIINHNGEMTGPPFVKYARNVINNNIFQGGMENE